MHTVPQKTSLVAETRAVLLAGMRSRRWVGELPGERPLGRELQVSRWTLRAAMTQLVREGFVRLRAGRACKILPLALESLAASTTSPRIAVLAPQPLARLRQFTSVWIDELRRILHERGVALDALDSPLLVRPRPERALERLVAASPHDAWLLLLCPRPVQAWFQARGLPAIVAGSCSDDVALPAVDADFRAAGVHAAHVLLRAGHRRIAWVVPTITTAGLVACEAGLRSALERSGDAALTVLAADGRLALSRALDRTLAGFRPTAVLCAKAGATLTSLCHLAAHGVRVPRDVSVLSIEAEPYFDDIEPVPSRYVISPIVYARHVARLVERQLGGDAPLRPEWLELTYFAGESVARAPQPDPNAR